MSWVFFIVEGFNVPTGFHMELLGGQNTLILRVYLVHNINLWCHPFQEFKDIELGKSSNKSPESNVNWSRIIAIGLATIILVAACAVTWIFQDWQTSLQVFAILVVVYIILFHWQWIYIAIMTAPRDFMYVWVWHGHW